MNQLLVGKFINQKRKGKNLTQEQLAEKIGVSNKTISKWETGKCMPDYSVIESQKEIDYRIYFTCHGWCYTGSFADLRGNRYSGFSFRCYVRVIYWRSFGRFFPSRLLFSL